MTSNKDFHFGLLRVSMIQLLKTHGFDRARPSTVDTFTDLFIRFLTLLTEQVQRVASARRTPDGVVYIQDISLALQNLGVIKPMNILDVYDENPELPGDVGLRRFKDWCENSTSAIDARMVAKPIPALLRMKGVNNSKATSKPLSLIPEYINQLNSGKRGDDIDNEESKLVQAMINNGDMNDWIRFMIMRQRLNAVREMSEKLPNDLESLPPAPGIKWSVLSKTQPKTNGDYLPVLEPNAWSNDANCNIAGLTSLLPVSKKENRLDCITLSFEEEGFSSDEFSAEDVPMDTADHGSEDFSQRYDFKDFDEGENTADTHDLKLGHSENIEYQELDDMQNTFERRDSLVYDNNPFDFNCPKAL